MKSNTEVEKVTENEGLYVYLNNVTCIDIQCYNE